MGLYLDMGPSVPTCVSTSFPSVDPKIRRFNSFSENFTTKPPQGLAIDSLVQRLATECLLEGLAASQKFPKARCVKLYVHLHTPAVWVIRLAHRGRLGHTPLTPRQSGPYTLHTAAVRAIHLAHRGSLGQTTCYKMQSHAVV